MVGAHVTTAPAGGATSAGHAGRQPAERRPVAAVLQAGDERPAHALVGEQRPARVEARGNGPGPASARPATHAAQARPRPRPHPGHRAGSSVRSTMPRPYGRGVTAETPPWRHRPPLAGRPIPAHGRMSPGPGPWPSPRRSVPCRRAAPPPRRRAPPAGPPAGRGPRPVRARHRLHGRRRPRARAVVGARPGHLPSAPASPSAPSASSSAPWCCSPGCPLRERPGLGTVLNVLLIGTTIDLALLVLETPASLAARRRLPGVRRVPVGPRQRPLHRRRPRPRTPRRPDDRARRPRRRLDPPGAHRHRARPPSPPAGCSADRSGSAPWRSPCRSARWCSSSCPA